LDVRPDHTRCRIKPNFGMRRGTPNFLSVFGFLQNRLRGCGRSKIDFFPIPYQWLNTSSARRFSINCWNVARAKVLLLSQTYNVCPSEVPRPRPAVSVTVKQFASINQTFPDMHLDHAFTLAVCYKHMYCTTTRYILTWFRVFRRCSDLKSLLSTSRHRRVDWSLQTCLRHVTCSQGAKTLDQLWHLSLQQVKNSNVHLHFYGEVTIRLLWARPPSYWSDHDLILTWFDFVIRTMQIATASAMPCIAGCAEW